MNTKTGKNCLLESENDTWDYSKNISIRLKDPDAPKIYTINFFHMVDWDATKYKPYFDVFEKAKETDEIIIYFNSPGGSVDVMNMFLNAFRTCKCKNITARINKASSAAAILALACNNIVFNTNSTMMLHTFSVWGMSGKSQELASDIKHTASVYRKMCEPYLKKIMTDSEIDAMENGKDFYFDDTEAIKRLTHYIKTVKKSKVYTTKKAAKKHAK